MPARAWPAVLCGLLVTLGVGGPVVYLLIRALGADAGQAADLLLRKRTFVLLGNTVLLGAAVLLGSTLLAFPYAWLTTRTELRGRKLLTVLGTLPLAIPGYVLAFVWLSLGGDYGLGAHVLGVRLWRPSGFWGAAFVLTLYTFPYLFLNLRAGLQRLDPALEEAAAAQGLGRWAVWRRVVLPQLRPAYLAGALLVLLHVIADFAVVSLMRYETLSSAVYSQYVAALDRTYGALLALVLVALAALLLVVDARWLRGRLSEALTLGGVRRARNVPLGRWREPAYAFAVGVPLLALALPVTVLVVWMTRGTGASMMVSGSFGGALLNSVGVALGVALLAPAITFPLLYASLRGRGWLARLGERIPYLGFGIPPMAFGLALVFLSVRLLPGVYQTLGLLVAALTIRFMAEAAGPLRSALYRLPPALEEAARSLGCGTLSVLRRVTGPLLWRGVAAAMALVFLASVKELPLTLILAPLGFDTLATNVWTYTEEALFAQAAPYALAIVGVAGLFVTGLVLKEDKWA
ncbi:MAG: iron ABC transporter permease [Planctomycetota bacterium]|nr:iron ABC transporter permease [Planctomycetota bacterium]